MPRGRKSENSVPPTEIVRPVPSNEITEGLIDRAYMLRDQKRELYKLIASNRSMIRGLRENEVLSADEARWADEFYSPKNMKSEENDANAESPKNLTAA